MNGSKRNNLLLYITYTIILTAALIKLDEVISFAAQLFLLLIPLFLGGAIAFILKKPFDLVYGFFQNQLPNSKTGLHKALSVLAVYIFLFGVIGIIFSFILPQLAKSWDVLKENITQVIPSSHEIIEKYRQQFPLNAISEIGEELSWERISDVIGKLLIGAMPQLYSVTNSIVKTVVNIAMGLVFSVYILIERKAICFQTDRFAKAFLSEKWYRRLYKLACVSNDVFTKFIGGQFTEALILGTLCFVGMIILRLEYALLISVLIGITSLIPIVGAFIGALPSVFILFIIGPQKALIFIVFLLVLQQFEGNIIYPKVVGASIGLPPLWMLIAITVGGGIFGVVGMMLAVPATSVIYRLICDEIDSRLENQDKNRLREQ